MYENCTRCGAEIESWDGNYYSRGMLCPTCYSTSMVRSAEKNSICVRCGIRMGQAEANMKLGKVLCNACYEDELRERKKNFCASCKKRIEGAGFDRPDGTRLCLACMRDQSPGGGRRFPMRICDHCGREAMIAMVTSDGARLCLECSQRERKKGIVGSLKAAIGKIKI